MELAQHSLSGLRPRRTLLRIPATQLASRLGVTTTTYNRFERGERRAYFDQAIALAAALGCTLEQLRRPPTIDEELELFRSSQLKRGETVPAAPDPGISTVVATPAPKPVEEPYTREQLLADWNATPDPNNSDDYELPSGGIDQDD
jgi:transcriptional regulator with XRE-family HTH domain